MCFYWSSWGRWIIEHFIAGDCWAKTHPLSGCCCRCAADPRNAYIQIAIKGSNFCNAAKQARSPVMCLAYTPPKNCVSCHLFFLGFLSKSIGGYGRAGGLNCLCAELCRSCEIRMFMMYTGLKSNMLVLRSLPEKPKNRSHGCSMDTRRIQGEPVPEVKFKKEHT